MLFVYRKQSLYAYFVPQNTYIILNSSNKKGFSKLATIENIILSDRFIYIFLAKLLALQEGIMK